MKKTFMILFMGVMCFTLSGCGEKEKTINKVNSEASNGTVSACEETKSTELFVDMYDYAEEFMMPDDGVYTGARDWSNDKGEKFFRFTVDCINEKGVENYDKKLREHGFERSFLTYRNTKTNIKISLADHSADMNRLYVWVYPSLDIQG